MDTVQNSRIYQYLKQIGGVGAPGGGIGQAAFTESTAVRIGLSDEGWHAASRAINTLESRQALSAEDRFQLEAIIIPDLRPPIRIRDGTFTVAHPAWQNLNAAPVRQRIETALPAIGRIELPRHPALPYGGTGFLVGTDLLMTNRHVAEIFVTGLGRRHLVFRPGLSAGVDFRKEDESDTPDYLDVIDVVLVHPYWDMALLRVGGVASHRQPLALDAIPADELRDRQVAVIGYPAFDPRNSARVQDRVFEGVYNVKRLQPGIVRDPRVIASFDHSVRALTHDSSTLCGNSGSAIIDLSTGSVIGLHFGGAYLDANFGVPAYDLSRDARVVDTGVRFAQTPRPGSTPADAAWTSVDSEGPAPASSANRFTVDVPLRITVELGEPSQSVQLQVVPPASVASVTEAMREPIRDPDYASRSGYDAEFLGIRVPFPLPKDERVAARLSDGRIQLPYHHFSVVMHARRRLALITGANVDSSPARARPEPRPDADYGRAGLGGLGPNDRERWFIDPRLPADQQLPDRFFTRDRKAFDKGHLVRRADVCWGASYDEVRKANGDTFHVTNCSPQVAEFNQASARNWGALENLVESYAKTERLCVFSGPVLSEADRLFTGFDDDGTIIVPIPSRYWKVIVARAGAELCSFGFVLEQDLSAVQWEFAVPADWRVHMQPIGKIEACAGIVFPDAVRASDQSGLTGGEAVARALRAASPVVMAPQQADDPLPAAPIDELLQDLAPILDGWRTQQEKRTGTDRVRLVLEFSGLAREDRYLGNILRDKFDLELDIGPLFADGESGPFRLLTISGVSRIDRPDLFDIARVVRLITGAATVDPDLGSDFYDFDPVPGAPLPQGPEGVDFTFWCWADPDRDRPKDPDWAMTKSRIREAWDYSTAQGRPAGGKGVRIFQPDTGIVARHDELPDKLFGQSEAANFVGDSATALDPMQDGHNPGHGTGTGSVIISAPEGAMSGVAPAATLIPVRCITSVAVFDQSTVAQAIDHARRNNAHVISMSLGGVPSRALHAALKAAVAANIIVVAAAGNCVGEVVWPARYDECIAVGGVNEADKPWRGSSRGREVAISGPAELVLRADPRVAGNTGAVSPGQGTSFATALLAGVAALWLAHHGRDELIARLPAGKTLQDLFRAVIRAAARVPTNGFETGKFGAGIVDALQVLKVDPVESLSGGPGAGGSAPGQLRSLLDSVFGGGAAEAVAGALNDPQNHVELACAALERLRLRRTRRALHEAIPPLELSRGLGAVLGTRGMRIAQDAHPIG